MSSQDLRVGPLHISGDTIFLFLALVALGARSMFARRGVRGTELPLAVLVHDGLLGARLEPAAIFGVG